MNMPEMKKAEPKPADNRTVTTDTLSGRDQDEVRKENLQAQEKKALEKLERIKNWPKEHQQIAIARTQQTLSQIRERMQNS